MFTVHNTAIYPITCEKVQENLNFVINRVGLGI